MFNKMLVITVIAVFSMAALVGCSIEEQSTTQHDEVESKASKMRAYIPKNNVELRNYNDAQKFYDNPSSILWCSTTWGNQNAPIITVPITGKLTSSTTTFFSPEKLKDLTDYAVVLPQRSIDGLFHPNPPQYRYGFTPGGQYVDFFNMPTYCSSKPSKFQRQETRLIVTPDNGLNNATREAEKALRSGDEKKAQQILEEAVK